MRVERVDVRRAEAACWRRDGHVLRGLVGWRWRTAARTRARAGLHRDGAVRVALALRGRLGRLWEREIADGC